MSRVIVLGAGISGHRAAAFLRKGLGHEHEVVVVSPRPDYNWIPSNIWVGVGLLPKKKVVTPLAPIYERNNIHFCQAKVVSIHPEGSDKNGNGTKGAYITVEHTGDKWAGKREKLSYDFLINATGPKLNFAATPGLGPDNGYTFSLRGLAS
jgi:sulfide:quinone oxidoreductase